MQHVQDALRDQREGAAARAVERTPDRRRTIEALRRPGGIAEADSPERIAKRVERLRADGPLPVAASDAAMAPVDGRVLEKIINSEDFVDIRYFERGLAAARAVGRIHIEDRRTGDRGWGTGSLVSPRLLLTNHHVLPAAEVAASSRVEFDYQDRLDGRVQSRVFDLDPATFFVADEERDFALVAVSDRDGGLSQYGFNRLMAAEGKAIVGEFVTIVQHPRGEKKVVALRENRIVDLLEVHMHYEADTEPGSSGSPVFNDQWEIVAVHHASVPAPEHDELGGFLNEGIRISRVVKRLREHELTPAQSELLATLEAPERIAVETAGPAIGGAWLAASGSVTVPLEITVRVGDAAGAPATQASGAPGAEAITIDPDYAARKGYEEAFLGTGDLEVPLPALPEDLLAKASLDETAAGDDPHVLRYHHFSVVMNRERRLAFLTASNIDGNLSRRMRRERDRWFLDPRIPAAEQVGEDCYRDNALDRGHLVRRLDPAWGNAAEAKLANDDTFHFTNCTPQHEDFNQNKTTWAGLEDYVLENADNRDLRISVFTGPVFAEDDDEYRDVQLPRQYWKVVAMVKENGRLSATAYLLSQKELLRGLEVEGFSYGEYRTFQVPVARVERLTRLSFGPLVAADPLGGFEATVTAREIGSRSDIVV